MIGTGLLIRVVIGCGGKFRFLEMEPIVFDTSDGEGKRIPRYVWTNIPDQNFQPKLDDIFERYSSSVWLPRHEPLLEKYPWIAEDLDAIHQPLPANYFRRRANNDRLKFRRETRAFTRIGDESFLRKQNLAHFSIVNIVKKVIKKISIDILKKKQNKTNVLES